MMRVIWDFLSLFIKTKISVWWTQRELRLASWCVLISHYSICFRSYLFDLIFNNRVENWLVWWSIIYWVWGVYVLERFFLYKDKPGYKRNNKDKDHRFSCLLVTSIVCRAIYILLDAITTTWTTHTHAIINFRLLFFFCRIWVDKMTSIRLFETIKYENRVRDMLLFFFHDRVFSLKLVWTTHTE